ncbi:ParB/RepB/Spo0J family partition protein [Nostoc punctiforme FACHB-252]|uniref:ParB/RepB/Spo0J family partition protein n=1 Tax=Nostoc punctiforme FACHB-252 TaxID=1357509 RepID=A0ABR8HJ38_NOSPU|nr:ParB/RepB/Spo0J family partition protein [Nostoc punctiforme]MBD2615881.1 ParB/RepB/Spo0J family partition protein [Nostoc punctiforme FACHB-252]
MSKKRLEVPKMRGVEDLLTMDVDASAITTVSIDKIRVAKKQPRRWFDPEKMSQLVQSVREHGILEPLLVRLLGDGEYELIAGERRLRAAKEAGLAEVPIVSKELSDKQALEVALLENLQREDLNPVEEVEAILELLAINLDVSAEEVKSILNVAANAKKRDLELTGNVSRQLEQIESLLAGIGRFNAESFRTSRLPLLNLPSDVLEVLRQGQLEFTKARTIAQVKDEQKRAIVLSSAISKNLSLTQIKELIKQLQSSETTSEATPEKVLSNRYAEIGKRLQQVKLWKDDKKRKKLERLLNDLEKLLDESDVK